MTGLSLRSFGVPSTSRDTFNHYDQIYLNDPWEWSPELLPWRDALQAPAKTSTTDPYAPPETDYSRSRKSLSKSTSTRKVVPRIATTDVELDPFPTRGGITDYTISEALTEAHHLLIYPLTFGFSLKSKIWVELDATRLQDVLPSEDSMENLIFANTAKGDEAPEKQIIKALAGRLKNPETWSVDYIDGKGAGAIILLHGPPGVGKTYTVESIAEMLQRPLLALSVADIGTVETAIEHELSKWFALADLWGAVLLIDEADIFLERRQTKDLARNSLVSAFLRQAEYFRGLLFLTTNRVGQIDDAFISRVHVAIRYDNLKAPELAQIWRGFFKKLSNNKSVKLKVHSTAKTWVIKQFEDGKYNNLNGRDIRNVLQTAITLAKYDHEQDPDNNAADEPVIVTQTHFERVLDMSYKFRKYIDSIRDQDEKTRASQRGERNDFEKGEISIKGKMKPPKDDDDDED